MGHAFSQGQSSYVLVNSVSFKYVLGAFENIKVICLTNDVSDQMIL